MNPSISLFEQEDLESLVDLLHDMSVHYNADEASTREAVRANLVENILGPNSDVRLVAARAGPRVVGLAAISLLYPAPKERGQVFMKELYVVSDHRGKGVGQQLMRWVAGYAVRRNCARFDWTVDASNAKALSFYREIGATHVFDKLYFRFEGSALETFAGQEDGASGGDGCGQTP